MTDPAPDPAPVPETVPETVRVTYAELAKARGCGIAAARKLTLRHRWPKQIGNDGLTRVTVPAQFMEADGRPEPDPAVIAAIAEATTGAVTGALTDLRTVLDGLRAERDAERARADRAEREVTALRAKLVASRYVGEVADGAMAELRERLDRLTALNERRRRWWPGR